jgi:hypothetical protein
MTANTNRSNTAGGEAASNPFGGRIYTPRELAQEWKLSESSIRKIFQDVDGIFVLEASSRRGKRSYQTLRIPRGVAERVWRERVTR